MSQNIPILTTTRKVCGMPAGRCASTILSDTRNCFDELGRSAQLYDYFRQ
jgi:hypothetical protein